MSPIFSLIGDSNIKSHVNKNSIRANPALKASQILTCGSFSIFNATLEKIRPESTSCIIACVTNFISSVQGPTTVSLRVDPVLQELRDVLLGACAAFPERSYLISPPMYRSSPLWYREGLPEIMSLFSQSMTTDKPPNLHILPSFATPDFEADGIHLTAYSGLEFILHLFDGAADLLANLALPLPERAVKGSESTRVLEDRMMSLEQDHRRLNRVVEGKTAADAELADFHANMRMEDFFVVSGLPLISDDLVGKAWQDRALKDVAAVILLLMGRAFPIVFVKNSTARHKDAEVTYSVQMKHVADSKAIRNKAGSYFLTGRDERPEDLKPYSFKNFVTPETRIRISILKLLARKYRESNPGSKVSVIGYQPRPMIKITPAASASDRRIMSFNYVQAVRKLPCSFSPTEIDPIIRRINPELLGQIRSIFIIISDDQFKKRMFKPRSSHPAEAAAAAEAADAAVSAGSEDESESQPPEASDKAPPRDSRSSSTSGRSSSAKSSRGHKRGASPSGSAAPAKK